MENIAHAFAGLLVAQGVVAFRGRRAGAAPSERFARYAAWVSALANNVPDGDLVLTPLTGGKLGYLMHHRGHTHTIVVGVVLGLLVALVATALARARARGAFSRDDARWLYGLGAFGPVLHLSMDGWNVYGVHPFWPIDDRWYYGDAVFILEPLLWLAAVPLLWVTTQKRVARALLGVVAALALGLPWALGSFVPVPIRIGLVLFAAISVALTARLGRARRPAAAMALFFAVPAVFLGTSRLADAAIRERAAGAFSHERVVDAAISAWPSNPFCWSAVVVSRSAADELVLRRASFALAPSLMGVSSCPRRDEPITAPLTEVGAPSDETLRWEGEHRVPLERLRTLARERCDVAALLRFLRAPFLVDRGDTFVVGDLRFDRDERLDFGEVELERRIEACPPNIPSWTPPRAKELDPP
jgi:inner membrane protein